MRLLQSTILVLSALLLTFIASPLQAAYLKAPTWDKRWRCGKEIPIKANDIRYLKKHNKLLAYRLKGKALPLLISEDYAGSGLIIYTRLNGRWRAYPISRSSVPMYVFSTASHFRISLFAMDANHHLTAFKIKNQLRNIQCRQVPVPAGIQSNAMQYLSLQHFNVLPSGTGELISAAYDATKSGKIKLRWFRSVTHNWGYSWGKPAPIRAPAKNFASKGLFFKAKMFPAPEWLITSLLRQAR